MSFLTPKRACYHKTIHYFATSSYGSFTYILSDNGMWYIVAIQGSGWPMLQNTEKHGNQYFAPILNIVKEKTF